MDVPYFIKEHPWISAFNEKIVVEVNHPQRWPWKEHATTVVAAVIILEVANNSRSVLQINILKKKRLWTLITFPLWDMLESLVSTQHIRQKFRRKNVSNWVIILIKSKVLWLLWMLYSTLAPSGPQLQRQFAYKSFLVASGPDCDLMLKIGHLQKTEVALKF